MRFEQEGRLRSLNQAGENYISITDLAVLLSLASEEPGLSADQVNTLRSVRNALLNGTHETVTR